MPCIDIAGLMKIENGQLFARNSCCEWVLIGGTNSPAEYPVDIPVESLPSGVEDFACRKAFSLGKFWEDVALVIAENDATDPKTFANAMRANVGYTNWSDTDLFSIWFEVFTFTEAIPGYDLAWSSEDTEYLICQAAQLLDPTTTTLDGDEFKACLNVVKTLKGPVYGGLWYDVLRTAENKRLNRVVQMGLWDDEADCSCPEDTGETVPTTSGWYLSAPLPDVTETGSGTMYPGYQTAPEHDVFGVSFFVDIYSGSVSFGTYPGTEEGWKQFWNGISPEPYNGRQVAGPAAAKSQLFGGYYKDRTTSLHFPIAVDDPTEPYFEQGVIYYAQFKVEGTHNVMFRDWRWIYNVNSPSHTG